MTPVDFVAIGVDPGITGAIAWLGVDRTAGAVQLLDVQDVPVATQSTNGSAKSHVILPALADLFTRAPGYALGFPTHVWIEDVHAMPGQGVTSMFRFGYVTGAISGVIAALGMPLTLIRPREWQASARVKPDPDAGRLRASQLFPDQAPLFARKKDHNRADAVLIGYGAASLFLRMPLISSRGAAQTA